MSTTTIDAPVRERLVLLDWVDKLCEKCESVRGIRIPLERRKALYEALKERKFPDAMRDPARLWILYGDWNRKKGAKTLEISDFFPSTDQLAQFHDALVSMRFHRHALEQMRRKTAERTEEEVRARFTAERTQRDLEDMARVLAGKTKRILELESDLSDALHVQRVKTTRLDNLERMLVRQADEIVDNRHWFIRVLNDVFRASGPDAMQIASMLPSWCPSEAVEALPDVQRVALYDAIRTATAYDRTTNPYHQWGEVVLHEKTYLWAIRYCRADGISDDGNPWDVVTCRRMMDICAEWELEVLETMKIGENAPL